MACRLRLQFLTRALHTRESSSTEQRRSEWRSHRCCHDKSVRHARCAGRVTKDTQHYPVSLVRVIHSAWSEHVHKTCRRPPSLRPCACAVSFRPSCAPELRNIQSVAIFAAQPKGPRGFVQSSDCAERRSSEDDDLARTTAATYPGIPHPKGTALETLFHDLHPDDDNPWCASS